MRNLLNINDLVTTRIRLRRIDKDGCVLDEFEKSNVLTKEGSSVMARLLVEHGAPRPSLLRARFASNLTNAQENTNFLSAGTLPDVSQSDFAYGAGAGIGSLREQMFIPPKSENADDIENGSLTFFFRLSADSLSEGTFDALNSRLFYLGMVAPKVFSDPSQDYIISVLDVSANGGVEIPNSGQLAVDYNITFTS